MKKQRPINQHFMKRHFIGLFLIATLTLTLFLPMLLLPPTTMNRPDSVTTPPEAEDLVLPPPIIKSVAGEPNFTRESWPFILNNYPDFQWENPGQFDGDYTASGITYTPTGQSRGYRPSLSAPGVGTPAYPQIYEALEGLNESNIRIMYLDSNYDWVSVPYQIDHKGWVNIWQLADMNRWGGLDANNVFSQGGGPNVAADGTNGLGWVAGDFVTSEGRANYVSNSVSGNTLEWDWYRLPIWTYVTPKQPDGSVTDETLLIDPEYADDLIWCYMVDANRPHRAWLEGDSGGGSGKNNAWNVATGDQTQRSANCRYARVVGDGWKPAWLNCTTMANPYHNADLTSNVIFIGDTWFTTPGDYATTNGGQSMPQWVRDAYPYQQINGALDKDDEIVFYAYPGRQAASWYWWNYTYFPHRFELQITDPVDGGQTWMYIYFNNETWADPDTGVNLGNPAQDWNIPNKQGEPTSDFISWDPDTVTLTSDYYQISINRTNPTLLDSVSVFGDTDGQPLATSMNRMYLYGYIAENLAGEWSSTWSFGKEGIWYDWSSPYAGDAYSELIASLENPCVVYPGVGRDTTVTTTYTRTGTPTGNRGSMASPQNYWGPQGIVRGNSPPLTTWEANYGDGYAVVDGPVRIIFYTQQWLATGLYVYVEVSSTVIINDYVDLVFPIMDGPSFYYRRVQMAPEALVEIPSLPGFVIQIYYAYIMCGNINPNIRSDVYFRTGTEWSGGVDDDGDNSIPTFGWEGTSGSPVEGWWKQGGLDPKTTTYTLNGISRFDGAAGDFYTSLGNPKRNVNPNPPNEDVCAGDGNNLVVPDWAIATTETHGAIWLYLPRREVMEIKDNVPFDYSAAYGSGGTHGSGWYGQPKLYFRDDPGHGEFGVCLDGGTSPWVQGGTSTSPYRLMMVYDDIKPSEAAETGHRLYLNYWFPLEGSGTFNLDPAPADQFLYDSVTPDKLIYKTGDTIHVDITGVPVNTIIDADFDDIDVSDPTVQMSNDTLGEWYVDYNIDSVDGSATDYERVIQFTADCLLPMYTTDSVYDLTVTIDNVAPTPASLEPLPTSTTEPFVLLDWATNPGYDEGCASNISNPSGLGKYRIRRGPSAGNYDTIVADNIPITTTQFLDSFVENGETYYYVIDTYDEVGNMATSSWEDTAISLPYTPAQPDDLPPTVNPSFTLDWTDNPGYGSGVIIDGYFVYYATSTDGSYPDLNSYILAPGGNVGSATTWTSPGSLTEATYYFLKVQTDANSGLDLNSTPVFTRCDTVAPAPAELATPLPTYNAEKEEIIVSWSIETLPQYQTGGFPGQDLNGIDHWVVYKKSGSGPWTTLATVPYSAAPEGQRVTDVSVSDGGTYSYGIRTYDAAGNSALCLFNKTTTLNVVGPGVAEVYSVEAATSAVQQGQQDLDITVVVRNPGATAVTTLNTVQLLFLDGTTDVTSDYSGVTQNPGGGIAAGANRTFTFTVDVSPTATTGLIDIHAETVYDTSESSYGALIPDAWTVLPNASLEVQSVSSTYAVVHPGEQDIPVSVRVKNPGTTNATLETIQLTFTRDSVDISNKFMVETITALPSSPFTGNLDISLNVTVSHSITTGGVIIDASVTGSAAGESLADSGAITTKTWAVSTWPKPVIANIVADKDVYWTGQTITLTVTCDVGGHTVKGYFGNLDSGAGNETASNPGGGVTYQMTHTVTSPVGESTYDVIVYAENASGTATDTIAIRLGQAPTFGTPTQNPADGNVEYDSIVDIDIDINDNGGQDNVDAYLKYRADGAAWIQRTMTYAGSGHWDVTIPEQTAGTYVEWVINASDQAGNWATLFEDYTVNLPPTEPVLVEGSESVHAAGDPGTVYNETPGHGAPLDSPIEYSVSIDTTFVQTPAFYVVLVSIFDPVRNSWININNTVWMQAPISVDVTLSVLFSSAEVGSGTLMIGKLFVLTDFPSNGGRTVSVLSFTHLVE